MVIIAEKEKLAKHIRLIERTYENNTNSDYTEKIEALGKVLTIRAIRMITGAIRNFRCSTVLLFTNKLLLVRS